MSVPSLATYSGFRELFGGNPKIISLFAFLGSVEPEVRGSTNPSIIMRLATP